MKYTMEEILNSKEYKSTEFAEFYEYKFTNGDIGQENLNGYEEEEFAELADEDGEIDCDIYLMDEEDYNYYICNNTSVSFDWFYPEGAKVFVAIKRR